MILKTVSQVFETLKSMSKGRVNAVNLFFALFGCGHVVFLFQG